MLLPDEQSPAADALAARLAEGSVPVPTTGNLPRPGRSKLLWAGPAPAHPTHGYPTPASRCPRSRAHDLADPRRGRGPADVRRRPGEWRLLLQWRFLHHRLIRPERQRAAP